MHFPEKITVIQYDFEVVILSKQTKKLTNLILSFVWNYSNAILLPAHNKGEW